MGSLSNLYISQSYQSLAHLGTNQALVPGTMSVLQDGIGQSLNISFDGTNISSSGNIYAANITASSINTGSLVTTSSFNSYTQSTNIRLNNLETTSASVNVSISNLNSTTSSFATSIANLNTTTASLNTSVTNLNLSSASQQVSINALNTFTASQSTASLVTSITELNTFSASALVSISSLNTNSASVNTSISALNTYTASQSTASIVTSINNLNTFSASALVSISNINSTTASLNSSVSQLNASSASQQVSINSLNSATASYVTETESGSFLVTASVVTNVITFTKGDGTQFNLTIAASGSAPAGTISGSAQITALGFVSSSVTASSLITASFDNGTRNLTFTKGDASTFAVNIPDVSGSNGNFVTTSSFNAYTQSNDQRVSSLEIATSSLYTSASLSLTSASISGQLLSFTKGNNTQFTVTLPTGSGTYVTGSYGAFQDSTTQSGSANTAYKMKFNTTDVSDGVILSGSTGLQVGAYGTYNLEWSGQLVEGSGASTTSVWVSVNGVYVSGSRGDVTVPSNNSLLPAWNYFLTLNQNDVVELWWSSTGGNTTWAFSPAGVTPTRPSTASIIATLNRVDVGGGSNSVSNTTFNAYTASTDSSISQLNASSASQQVSIDNLNQ